jgi:hypothetical protein
VFLKMPEPGNVPESASAQRTEAAGMDRPPVVALIMTRVLIVNAKGPASQAVFGRN